jgi:hypothetical protein
MGGRGHGTSSRPTGMFIIPFNPESEGSIFPHNAGIHLQDYMHKNPKHHTVKTLECNTI